MDDTVLVSDSVIPALNLDLRTIGRPASSLPAAMTGYQIDCSSEIPSSAYGGESFWPTHYSATPISPIYA